MMMSFISTTYFCIYFSSLLLSHKLVEGLKYDDHTPIQPKNVKLISSLSDTSLKVSSDFQGGSATVLFIDAATQTIRITPAGKAQRGMPVWWYLRIDNIDVSRPIILEVVQNEKEHPTNVHGQIQRLSGSWTWPSLASYSTDQINWKHSEAGERVENKMIYRLKPDSKTIWIAWGPPFTPLDAEILIERTVKEYPFASAFVLSKTREGRLVRGMRISEGDLSATKRPAIWIHARQHAWEVGSSWVASGCINWIIGNSEEAKWLRQHTEIYIVPIMDVDHVATGDGGKHAFPRDHNRDWTAQPHWPEIAATQQKILSLAKEGRMSVLLDLHNPGPGSRLEAFYIVNKAYIDQKADARQIKFMELAREQFVEVIQHDAKPPLQHPEEFYQVCDGWVSTHANPHTIAVCVETPWNTPESTVEGYGKVGEKLGRILEKLLKHDSIDGSGVRPND